MPKARSMSASTNIGGRIKQNRWQRSRVRCVPTERSLNHNQPQLAGAVQQEVPRRRFAGHRVESGRDDGQASEIMIFAEPRDFRFITVRRGGSLSDAHHRLLAIWAATCAEHVLHLFESAVPGDDRPRRALEQCHAWVRGEIPMRQAHKTAFTANASARNISGAPKFAAYAAGQAVAVAHVAAHELGAAAYAIRAVQAAADEAGRAEAGRRECRWQREQLPAEIRDLVLDDQRLRNHVCWSVFDC